MVFIVVAIKRAGLWFTLDRSFHLAMLKQATISQQKANLKKYFHFMSNLSRLSSVFCDLSKLYWSTGAATDDTGSPYMESWPVLCTPPKMRLHKNWWLVNVFWEKNSNDKLQMFCSTDVHQQKVTYVISKFNCTLAHYYNSTAKLTHNHTYMYTVHICILYTHSLIHTHIILYMYMYMYIHHTLYTLIHHTQLYE